MTNEQMQKYFGIEGYRTISIALKEHADAVAVDDEPFRASVDTSPLKRRARCRSAAGAR